MDKIMYLDNAATTQVFPEIYDILKEHSLEGFYNPSAAYKKAILVKHDFELARKQINTLIGGESGKLIFTSSATESNNTVFKGVHIRPGQIVLVSAGEHPSVYQAAHDLEKRGIIVNDIPLTNSGVIDFEKFKLMLNEKVALISVMHVSNETGAVNDIKKLCAYAKSVNSNIIFHSDGVQSLGKVEVNLNDLGVDLYSMSAHKIYAPRGISALWIKNKVVIDALLLGGGQENNYRSSTENVDGAIAFAYAVKRVCNELDKNRKILKNYREKLLKNLFSSEISEFLHINSNEDSVPNILSISFKNIKGEVLIHALEEDGILVSTGSACSSKKAGNRTLKSMGLPGNLIIGSIRISFSPYLDYDIDYISNSIIKNVLRFEKNVR